MDIVFRMHLGEVCYEYLEQEIVPNVFLVDTESTLSPYKRYTLWNGELSIPKVITDLAENESRNNKILHFLEKSYHKGRTILVLGERLDQLRSLHDAMTECPSKAMCVGSMKAADRTEALKARIIFATHQIAKEGLDKPDLDTLFILIPFANEGRLQQSVGRILRKTQNKSKPVVVVFYDSGVEVMLAFSRKMRKWFLKNKYSVSEINC
jgi:superfamily II DNA or RNA helicase